MKLKIIFNEDENHEITLPETISLKELFMLIDRLEKLGKYARTNVFDLSKSEEPEATFTPEAKPNKVAKKRRNYTKEDYIELLRLHFARDADLKLKFPDVNHYLIVKAKKLITPQEMGWDAWPEIRGLKPVKKINIDGEQNEAN